MGKTGVYQILQSSKVLKSIRKKKPRDSYFPSNLPSFPLCEHSREGTLKFIRFVREDIYLDGELFFSTHIFASFHNNYGNDPVGKAYLVL